MIKKKHIFKIITVPLQVGLVSSQVIPVKVGNQFFRHILRKISGCNILIISKIVLMFNTLSKILFGFMCLGCASLPVCAYTVSHTNNTASNVSVMIWSIKNTLLFQQKQSFRQEVQKNTTVNVLVSVHFNPVAPDTYIAASSTIHSGIAPAGQASSSFNYNVKLNLHPVSGGNAGSAAYYLEKNRIASVQIAVDGGNRKIEYAFTTEAADRSPVSFMDSSTLSTLFTKRQEFKHGMLGEKTLSIEEDGDNNNELFVSSLVNDFRLRAIIYRDSGGTTNLVWKAGAGLLDSRKLPPYSSV